MQQLSSPQAADELVEACAVAMVREFLARRGLRGVLAVLDEVRPPKPSDISSRTDLMQQVCALPFETAVHRAPA